MELDVLHTVTDQELLRLSQRNPGYQFERTANGRLVVSPTGGDGGRRSGEVFGQLYAWSRHAGRGAVFDSSTGFRLPDGSLRSPDASWVSTERWEALAPMEREGFPPLCPDVVFEVRSRTDSPGELDAKLRAYVANGARLAILIDPESHTVLLYRPDSEPERHHPAASLSCGPELDDFVLDLARVWM